MLPTEKAIKTGELTAEEINSLTNEELMKLLASMKRHADFETNQVDFKHAMHLVRLLRMGAEALETGVINVRRPDATELLDIRAGKWTYEEVVEYAEDMDNKVRNVLYPTTQLRKKPDIKLAAELILTAQDMMWTKN